MHFQIQSCINCGSFLYIENCLCQFCYTAIIDQFSVNIRIENENRIAIKALLKWNPEESDTLSILMYRLKRNQKNLWKKLAFEFIRSQKLDGARGLTLVSVLSNTKVHTHAQDWGASLAYFLGCDHRAALVKSNESKQKEKSKIERKNMELVPIVDISTLSNKKVIFVDDVITTGATLNAAHKALGCPRDFECWSLAMRTTASVAN